MRTRALLAACVAALAVGISAAPAFAQGQWIDGNTTYAYGNSCIILGSPTYETQVGGFTGYWGTTDAASPKVGDRYWGHIYYTVTGVGCGFGVHGVQAEIALPAGTALAIDPGSTDPYDKIQCFRTNLNGSVVDVTDVPWQHPGDASITGKHCRPTTTSVGANGTVLAYTLLAQGQSLHIVFPLRSTRKLSGIAEPNNASRMTATISEPGITTNAQPFQWVFVGDRPVEGSCPALGADTASAVTGNTAHTKNYMCNWYRSGKAQIEIGEQSTGAYQAASPQYTVEGQYQGYYFDQDWNNLTPGTTYHWRLKFVDDKGTVSTADDQTHYGQPQTFTTTGTRPAGPTTTPGAGTGGTGGNTTPGGTTPGGNQQQQQPPPEQQMQQPDQQQERPDTQAPTVRSAAAKTKLATLLKKGLRVTANCSEACSVAAQLQIPAKTAKKLGLGKKLTVIGKGSASSANAGDVGIPVKLTKKAKARLKRARSLKAKLVVTATDAAGNRAAPITSSVSFKR